MRKTPQRSLVISLVGCLAWSVSACSSAPPSEGPPVAPPSTIADAARPQQAAAGTAARPPGPALLALAAGYKSLFACNGRYAAQRTLEDIKAGELSRTYRDYDPAFAATPDPVFDDAARSVSTRFAADSPPRIAVWREHFGCTLLPKGAAAATAAGLPRLASAAAAPDRSAIAWPAGDRPSDASALGADARAALSKVLNSAFDRKTYGPGSETTAVLVASRDAVLAEQYRADFGPYEPQRTWSAAKSMAATLIGVAVGEGRLRIDDPADLPEWRETGDPRRAITLRHLLNMASGLDAGTAGSRTDDVYFGGARVADHSGKGSLLHPPGSRFNYANNDTMLTMRVLAAAYPDREAYWTAVHGFFDSLGMTHTTAGVDWTGDYIMSSQVWTTARDLARLGLLYLDDGVRDGRRILPEEWARFVASPAPAQPPLEGRDGAQLPGYGAQFWLWGERHGLPEGSYAAQGNRGQYLMIVPATGLVIVRRGLDAPGAGFDIAAFSANVLAAIEPE
ncbi:serine hydrolase [bacterium]|nr:serine hydrolase [bacterium]